jgi:hypothetical protein
MNYRFILRRKWIGTGGTVNFVMLNPSTADDVFDDPTIRRCVGFAKSWGFSELVVTNLFGYRATDPGGLKRAIERGGLEFAIGRANDAVILEAARYSESVVCAWGGGRWMRAEAVMSLLAGFDLGCIRLSPRGFPVHPVRERYTSAPEVFRVAQKVAAA